MTTSKVTISHLRREAVRVCLASAAVVLLPACAKQVARCQNEAVLISHAPPQESGGVVMVPARGHACHPRARMTVDLVPSGALVRCDCNAIDQALPDGAMK